MKLGSLIVLRPVCFFIILALAVLLLPSLVLPILYRMVQHIEHEVTLSSIDFETVLLSEIENTAKVLSPLNSSARNLARVLSSSVEETNLTFSDVESKIAPSLFQALSTIPHLVQISYIGMDGLFYSYYTNNSYVIAVYSNEKMWYTQPVNSGTGKLYGEAIYTTALIMFNESWIQDAMNSSNGYASSIEFGWNYGHELVFLNTAKIDGVKAVVSLGFQVKALTEFFSSIDFHGATFSMATKDGKVIVEGLPDTHMVVDGDSVSFEVRNLNSDQIGHVGKVSCKPDNDRSITSILGISGTKYKFYCSSLEVMGVQSVYVMGFPLKGMMSHLHKNRKVAFILLVLMLVTMVITIFSFIVIIVRAAKREMQLCTKLIKQMEATQQSERKSMNKSLAFANASHDVRASLAGITGLIDISYGEVVRGSELETNLNQMESCTKDLLSLLNSILDTSKIEAGKMQLEEEDFNLAQLLEDVVDLYHPVGIKKGVDVLLDLGDGSVIKFSNVKGDRGKLKQILCNLLSNAVKFTSEGHVTVRIWGKKPSLETSILASNRRGLINLLAHLCFKKNEAYSDLAAVNPNYMEFVFEVDDTGKGIPKEKHKSVFENYVQVKETALGQGGTGLGLGIVQSLVRLMGGEIGIVDKGIGEKGTCFKFNCFLSLGEMIPSKEIVKEEDTELGNDWLASEINQHSRITIPTPSPKLEGSRIVLLIQNEERRRISQKFMETLGIKVLVVENLEHLTSTLKKMRRKLSYNFNNNNSSGKSDSSSGCKDVPLSSADGSEQILSIFRKTSLRGISSSFILFVIEASAGPFPQLFEAVATFRKDLHSHCCKVVWLEKPHMRSIHFRGIDERIHPDDFIISKPFHGTRLMEVIRLLPEFGGSVIKTVSTTQVEKAGLDSSSSTTIHLWKRKVRSGKFSSQGCQSPIQENNSSGSEKNKPQTKPLSPTLNQGHVQSTVTRNSLGQVEIHVHSNLNGENPLIGKKILVADDTPLLQQLARVNLTRLGANVELCKNGKEALDLVCKGLSDQNKHGALVVLPFDYILMDCEMPVMNGYEATRQIREFEKYYNVHIPIIALTAHTEGEEARKTIQAGMDAHLGKPLSKENLINAIRRIQASECNL